MVRSQPPASFTIGQLAIAGGVGVETIRFYQRKGLIDTPPRAGGIRRYDADTLRRLRFIRQAQAAGFTLDEIAELLTLDAQEDRERVRALARARIRLLDRRLVEIRQARDALRRLARACESAADGPCPILTGFEV